ncbi:hypothetical protein ES705_18323 [subsurface metagenome]
MDVTSLKILSKMAQNETGTNARFRFVNPETKEVICSSTNLEELYSCIQKIDQEIIQQHVCTSEESENVSDAKDLAFYIHYVFGDVEMSMKIYMAAERFNDNSAKLKLELVNIMFTRLLNFSEISLIPD